MPEFIPQHTPPHIDAFTEGYLNAAEWLLPEEDYDVDGNPVPPHEAIGFAAETIARAVTDCIKFQEANAVYLEDYYKFSGRDESSAGHDFWLSRNGHGAGFLDRGDESCFARLQEVCRQDWSEVDPHVDDDGLIYFY